MLSGFLRRLNIGQRLTVAFAALVSLTFLISVFSIVITQIEDAALADFELAAGAVVLAEDIEINILSAQQAEKDFLLRHTIEGFETATENYLTINQSHIATAQTELEELRLDILAEGERAAADLLLLDQIEADIDIYVDLFAEEVENIEVRGDENSGFEGRLIGDFDALDDVVDALGMFDIEALSLRTLEEVFEYLLEPASDSPHIAHFNDDIVVLRQQISTSSELTAEQRTELIALVEDAETSFYVFIGLDDTINSETAQFAALADLDTLILEIIQDQKDLEVAALARVSQVETIAQVVDTVLAVVALVLGVSLAVVVRRSIVDPVGNLTEVTRGFAEGDLTIRADDSASDEMGFLAQAFNDMAASVERRNRDVQAIVDVSGQIATVFDEERLLQDVADLAKERFNLYHAHIYRLNETGDTLVLTAGAGYIGRQMVAEHRIIDIENLDSIVAGTARSGGNAVVNDVRAAEDFLAHPLLPDTRSELAVALVARGQLLGVLDVQSDEVGYFDEDTLGIMETLAAQISGALSNARLFQTAERSSRHAQALSSIQENMQSAVDMEDMLQRTARELAKALRVPYAAIELKLDTSADSENGNQLVSEEYDENEG